MLERCPFCGGDGELIDGSWSWVPNGHYAVHCTLCSANTAYSEDQDEAISFWNTREENEDGKVF